MLPPTTFTYNFSTSPASKPAEPETELFALDKLSEFRLDGDQVLARNPRTGGEMVLPLEFVNVLVTHCNVFRTLDGHVAELMEGSDGAPERAAAIRDVVESVRKGGLTISAGDICQSLAPPPSPTPIADRPVLVILTCDRPEAVERLLRSILANTDADGIECCYVVDDSRSAENGRRNRDIAASAARGSPIGIQYFGADEARELTAALVRALPRHENEIRFLLDRDRWAAHKSYGLARNFSHLLSVGRPVVVFDDDVLCEAYDSPYPEPGVTLFGGPREATFYADNDEWRSLLSRSPFDPVTGHLRCLGLNLPEAVPRLGLDSLPQQSLITAPVDFARQLRPDSRVLITECGSVGDPGTGNNRWLALIPRASRERVGQTGSLLRRALEQRCCWLGRLNPVFRPGANISQITGFDNRVFLPPYFPVTRGEDRLFGQVTRFIYPRSVTLEYPWAAPHLPLSTRTWTDADNSHAAVLRFPGTLLDGLFHKRDDCGAADPQARLGLLAGLFADLAASPDQALLDRFIEDRHGFRAAQIRSLHRVAEESSALTPEWRSYVDSALGQIRSTRPGELRLDSLAGTVAELQGPALLGFWRDAWQQFGDALLAWQAVREAAREILAKTSTA